jgi:tRNA/rRNA methyltransferase
MFHRMNLTQQDVRTLWGAVVRLVEGPRKDIQTRKRNKSSQPRIEPAPEQVETKD